MTYVQSHFCNSMIDPDIYLLQVSYTFCDPRYSLPEHDQPINVINVFSFYRSVLLGLTQITLFHQFLKGKLKDGMNTIVRCFTNY